MLVGKAAKGMRVGKAVTGVQADIRSKEVASTKYQYKLHLQFIDRIIAKLTIYVNLTAVAALIQMLISQGNSYSLNNRKRNTILKNFDRPGFWLAQIKPTDFGNGIGR
jgi:hypothetical protein